jgi:hypothetical protein
MSGSARSGGTGLGCAGLGVTGSIGRREVGRVARVGRVVWEGRGRSVGRTGFDWSVGPLDTGNESLFINLVDE